MPASQDRMSEVRAARHRKAFRVAQRKFADMLEAKDRSVPTKVDPPPGTDQDARERKNAEMQNRAARLAEERQRKEQEKRAEERQRKREEHLNKSKQSNHSSRAQVS
jgi:chromatin segregation and condensation protein Rec8/ScpA/Scc1 (kleisin family)